MKHQIKIICGALTVLALVTGSAWATVTQDTEFNNERADMPQGLWEAFAKARLLIEPVRDTTTGARFTGQNPGNKLRFEFNENGVIFKPSQRAGDWVLGMQLESYGNAQAYTTRKLHLDGNTVTLDRGDIQEWYINRPNGLEQGFTLAAPPQGYETGQDIAIAIQLTGNLEPKWESEGQSIAFYTDEADYQFSYDKLVVLDANGRNLPAKMKLADGHLQLQFDPAGAQWPVVVDPIVSTVTKLVGESDDYGVNDQFGNSVAMEGDTAIIGSHLDDFIFNDSGFAYVFVRSGESWRLQGKLIGSNPFLSDLFGTSVALSGDTALVGAPGEEGTSNKGKAYVFTRDGDIWSQQEILTASDAAADDGFGFSVALSGDTALIGAYMDDVKDVDNGSAYVFVLGKGGWVQESKLTLTGATNSDYFGSSVALQGDTALIGAPYDSDLEKGTTNNGAAYIFTRSDSTWSQGQKLLASDAANSDLFGTSVDLSNDKVIIGAPDDGDFGLGSGSAYVFYFNGSTWLQEAKLNAGDAAAGDRFGWSVSIDSKTTVIGAFRDDDNGTNSGSAYVFITNGVSWGQQQKLTASDATAGDAFGWSVAISGDSLIAGAYGDDDGGSGAGSAYVFTRTGSNWFEQKKLTAVDVKDETAFGYSVALEGDTALIGAWQDDLGDLTVEDGGAAYVFVRSGGAWSQQQKLIAWDAAPGDNFGESVDLSGDTALIGAPKVDGGTGSAYVFTRSGSDWSPQQKLTAADADIADNFGASVALDGDTALIGASLDDDGGSASGSAYIFTRTGSIWSQQQKLTAADADIADYFGASVALDGDTALIGAYYDDGGSAYVFARTGSSWSQQQKLTAADADIGDWFGVSVALDGDTALIGAQLDGGGPGPLYTGSAYVYTRTGSSWSQQQKLVKPFAADSDQFGHSVALDGDRALIGSQGDGARGTFAGSATLFVRTGNTWASHRKLIDIDGLSVTIFGKSVALSGDTALVGATNADCTSGFTCGAAYVHHFVCGYGRGLLANRWTMVGIPCDTGANNTVEDVFGDNLNPANYNSRWVVYDRDESTDAYSELDLSSPMELGQGYWIISVDATIWDADGTETPVSTTEPNCPSDDGCYVISLTPPVVAGPPRFNLIGQVFPYDVEWEDVRFEVDGTAYTPGEAEAAALAEKEMWLYNGNGYDVFDDTTPGMEGILASQDGIWVAVLNGAAGKTVRLLVPVSNVLNLPPLPPIP